MLKTKRTFVSARDWFNTFKVLDRTWKPVFQDDEAEGSVGEGPFAGEGFYR